MGAIVVGYDGSDVADRAVDRAAELARLYEAKLVVTSSVPVLVAPATLDGPGAELRAAAERARTQGADAELVEAAGDPGLVIVEVADRYEASLIVVGTREPSMIERLLGHSVSESVQRKARCDVLIVH